ncbi:MAG: DMT family transporter [Saccharospirillum sp.]|nr:DMT family transporter [Saccharospirillum sp.]
MTPQSPPLIDHRQGILIAGIGVFVLSFDALLVRLAGTSEFNVAFWRGTFVFISMSLFIIASGRLREFRQYWLHGWAALVVTVLYGINTGLFVISVSHTSVANTVVILSSSAFFAALFSWLIIRETIPLRTWVAILVAMVGVVVVFAGSMGLDNWRGDLVALLLAVLMGLTLTLLRRLPNLPKMPVVAMSGVVTAVLAFGFAQPLSLEPASYGWLALMGLLQMPIASVMLMMATKYLPSPEVSLFLLIEAVLGPVWVWLILNESIPPMTLVGGSAILGAVFVHSWLATRKPPARVDVPTSPPL